jgi:molybdopterin-guanine dinucleotide biosynthesis protein A
VTRIAGLILAGGAASRIGGGDKPLLNVGGRPMLARILHTLAADLTDIAISANGDPTRFASLGCPVLDDGVFVGEGPLAGILAGLDWAAGLGCSALLSVPGDTPFVPRGLAALLATEFITWWHFGRWRRARTCARCWRCPARGLWRGSRRRSACAAWHSHPGRPLCLPT